MRIDPAVDDADLVAFFGDDPLHERLLGLQRVVEHHDVADLRIADAVGELVDDQAILILERRRHALPSTRATWKPNVTISVA